MLTRQVVVQGDELVSDNTGNTVATRNKNDLLLLQPIDANDSTQRRLTTSTCELTTADAVGSLDQSTFETQWASLDRNNDDSIRVDLGAKKQLLDLTNVIWDPFPIGSVMRYAGMKGKLGVTWYHIDCPNDGSGTCYLYKSDYPVQGPMVSGVTSDTAVVGFRTEYPCRVRVEYSATEDFASGVQYGLDGGGSDTIWTSPDSDCTSQFTLSNFGGADLIYYRFEIDGTVYDDGKVTISKKELGADVYGDYLFRFKPLPSEDTTASFSFVVFSDAAVSTSGARTENSYLNGGNEFGADRDFALQIGDVSHILYTYGHWIECWFLSPNSLTFFSFSPPFSSITPNPPPPPPITTAPSPLCAKCISTFAKSATNRAVA